MALNPPWTRIGSAGHPVDVRDVPHGTATVSRASGGKWTATIVLHFEAGDDRKARAWVDGVVAVVESSGNFAGRRRDDEPAPPA